MIGQGLELSTVTAQKKWSAKASRDIHALDLERGVFRHTDPREIALSLKRSAMNSKTRKEEPYQSAMAVLNFYINRAGKHLPERQRQVLEDAKEELRKVFGKSTT